MKNLVQAIMVTAGILAATQLMGSTIDLLGQTSAGAEQTEVLLASAATAASQPATGKFSYKSLLSAAQRAMSGASKDCYRTSARTARLNGGSDDGWSWPEDTSYRGQSLRTGLGNAIANGTLKPGMIIYANKRPGTDPSSLNLSNLPHWFTYLGKDANGVPRFSDQYATDFDLSGPRGIAATYAGRVIDAFYDPY